jgi:hypothetical protein
VVPLALQKQRNQVAQPVLALEITFFPHITFLSCVRGMVYLSFVPQIFGTALASIAAYWIQGWYTILL